MTVERGFDNVDLRLERTQEERGVSDSESNEKLQVLRTGEIFSFME